MKIRNAFLMCVMLAICSITGLTHQQVQAANWFDNTGFSYPAPPEVTSGVPGYVPFNNDFSVLSGSNSTILTRNSSNVGLVVNQSKTNQKGAIWSNNPIFDLSKQHQSLAMNLLIQASAFNLAGDGMAFALAGTRPTSLGLDGGAIGVWGQEINASTSGTSTLAASGLQKSAVITFDTFFNQTTYDKAVDTYRHYIGFGYPGEPSSYTIDSQTTTINNQTGYPTHIVFPSSASVAPNLTLSSTPASPLWHIFNVSWNRNSNNDGGTLTYSASDVGKYPEGPVVKQVTWSDSDIQNHFGTSKLYIGFTGSTGAQTEDNVLSFRTLPDIVNASGNVKLTRLSDNTTVTDQTTLKTNDALNYHFSLTYDASSNQSWPSSSANQLVMYVPKSKYLIASQKSIRVTGSDGSSASVNVDASSATQLKLTGFNNFLQGTSKTITFDIPVNVNGAVDNTISVNSSLDVSDDTATMVGNNAQVQVTNPAQTSDPYSIQYTVQNTGAAFVPPVLPELATVPDLRFINTPRFFLSGLAAANPTVSELIHGSYTRSDDVQQSASDSNTSNPPKLPYISTSDDFDDLITPSNNPKGPQLLTAAYNNLTMSAPTNPQLSINGNNTKSNWNLSLQLSPFKSAGASQQPLPRPARIVFITEGATTSAAPASYLPKPADTTHPALVTDGTSTATTILTSNTAQSMKSIGSNTSGDGGFTSAALVGLLYFDQKLPTVQAGSYTSTATWTLSTTP